MDKELLNKTGIYKITNKIDGKFYYGSASESFRRRWESHRGELTRQAHANIYLQRAWNKYGADIFEFNIILVCAPEDCLYYEQLFLNKYWDNCKVCYNMCPTAGNCFGKKDSNETRKKKSDMRRGKKLTDEAKKKVAKSKLGISRTEDTKKKISQKLLNTGLGSKNPNSKYKEEDIIRVKILTHNGVSIKEIQLATGINRNTLKHIRSGRTWKHINIEEK